jgi:hypothetical protein
VCDDDSLVQEVKKDWYSEPGKPYQTLRVNKRTGHLDVTASIPKSGGFLGDDKSSRQRLFRYLSQFGHCLPYPYGTFLIETYRKELD